MGNAANSAGRTTLQHHFAYPAHLSKSGLPKGDWRIGISGRIEKVVLATTTMERLRGLLFRSPSDTTLLLVPCHDVHTFGMGHPIDIAFISSEGDVLEVHRNVYSRRRLRNKGAAMVAERFSRADKWLERGDRLHLGISKELEHSGKGGACD